MVLTAYVVDIKKSMYVVLVDFSIGWYARFASKGQKWTNRQPFIKGRNCEGHTLTETVDFINLQMHGIICFH